MKTIATTALLMVLATAGVVAAQSARRSESRKRIDAIGVTPSGPVFNVAAAEASTECFFGLMAIDLETEVGRAQYALLLSAKAQDRPIDVLYSVDDSGTCNLEQIVQR